MNKGTGILLDEQIGDLKISVKRDLNGKIIGGMVVGDSSAQNQHILLRAHIGELKHAPVSGVGITDMLLDNDSLHWQTRVRQALENEGFKIKKIQLTINGIEIDANY